MGKELFQWWWGGRWAGSAKAVRSLGVVALFSDRPQPPWHHIALSCQCKDFSDPVLGEEPRAASTGPPGGFGEEPSSFNRGWGPAPAETDWQEFGLGRASPFIFQGKLSFDK